MTANNKDELLRIYKSTTWFGDSTSSQAEIAEMEWRYSVPPTKLELIVHEAADYALRQLYNTTQTIQQLTNCIKLDSF